jgi:hypothetical protein
MGDGYPGVVTVTPEGSEPAVSLRTSASSLIEVFNVMIFTIKALVNL